MKKKTLIGWTFPDWYKDFKFTKANPLSYLDICCIYRSEYKRLKWENCQKPIKVKITIEEST